MSGANIFSRFVYSVRDPRPLGLVLLWSTKDVRIFVVRLCAADSSDLSRDLGETFADFRGTVVGVTAIAGINATRISRRARKWASDRERTASEPQASIEQTAGESQAKCVNRTQSVSQQQFIRERTASESQANRKRTAIEPQANRKRIASELQAKRIRSAIEVQANIGL